MKQVYQKSGFTMVELLFVIVVIGVMLAVISPRAYRANIDAKYGVVRQGAAELVSYATEWASLGMASQDLNVSTSSLDAYMASLVGVASPAGVVAGGVAAWIADATPTSNWNTVAGVRPISGRNGVANNDPPETTIQGLIPAVKIPVNPFNGVNVFSSSNDPTANAITGALACAGILENDANDPGWHYYALIFQGTDSTGNTFVNGSFYAGQDPTTLAGLRNGIFLARER